MAGPLHASDPEPLVSVCIPVYNGEAHLAAALDSVLGQSYRNLEILVFDDGSTDASPRILAGIRDPRLVVHRNATNLGPEANWNLAFAAGRGRYIKLFHQDDLLEPDCLHHQVAALEAHPAAVLAFCSRRILRADGSLLLVRRVPWQTGLVTQQEMLLACANAGTNVAGEPSGVLVRRSVAERTGGFDGTIPYLIDLDYWLRLMGHGPAWGSQQALAAFRVSRRQWSAAIGRDQGRQFTAFMERMQDRLGFRLRRRVRIRARLMAVLNGMARAVVYRLLAGGG